MVFASIAVSLAYIGPGPGLTMLWALIGLVVTVVSAVVAVLFLPARMVLRRLRAGAADAGAGSADPGEPIVASDGAD